MEYCMTNQRRHCDLADVIIILFVFTTKYGRFALPTYLEMNYSCLQLCCFQLCCSDREINTGIHILEGSALHFRF